MGEYVPKPRDQSGVELPADIADLAEALSKNTHEVWARKRMVEGWKYGKERNDALKQHPDLVPYEELSEQEKAYDRETALSAIKFIINEGFEIRRKP